MTDREEFLQIFRQHVTRPGADKLLDWLHLQKGEKGVEISLSPVPLEKYKYHVTRYYTDNFRFD